MTDHSTPIDCSGVADHLLDLKYGELDEALQLAVEEHLAVCAACQSEFDAMQDTLRTLDEWPPVEAPCDAAALAALVETQSSGATVHRRTWAIRLRPVITGLAAGLVLFATLAYFKADVRIEEGRLVLSLGRGEIDRATFDPEVPVDAIPASWREYVQREFQEGTIVTMDAMDDALRRWEARQDSRHLALLETLDRVRAQDMQLVDNALRTVVRSASEETLRTRQAVDGIARLVADRESTRRKEY